MSEYAKRDLIGLAGHYTKHVQAMTAEGLHTKSDIAAELAWRDAENERLTAERYELRDVLLRNGFVPCDIPACNCGSWHHRYGLPERMQEIKDALAEAGHELSNANGNLPINALKALVAERDELRRQLDEARAEREAMANVLPGVYYMDPPDGGDVSLLKQLQRMSNDAARYRLLRRKFAIISDGEGNAEFCPINLPRPTYIAPNTAIELDTALDRERLGLDGAKRPPTPVGWSDTDWIKHLQEQAEQPHPLAGQHINAEVALLAEAAGTAADEIERLTAELETERMRLTACGVAALANTADSAARARDIRPEYRSASLDDVERAVDREIQLRDERDELRRQISEAETDARRYRDWLRGGANIPPESNRWPRWEVRCWNGRFWNTLFAEAMDAAIDEAMGLTRPDEET